jgi:hypothetical protein
MAAQFDGNAILANILKTIDGAIIESGKTNELLKLAKDYLEAARLEEIPELEDKPIPLIWQKERPTINMIKQLKNYGILPAENLTKYDCWGLLKFLYKYPALKIYKKENGDRESGPGT